MVYTRLKNIGDEKLSNLNIKIHSLDTFHIYFRNPSDHIFVLCPEEERSVVLLLSN
jgi:hypothetical protein